MENVILTPAQAWHDFYAWVLSEESGINLTVPERHYIHKTNRGIDQGNISNARLKKMFDRHCPGRYQFVELSGFKKV